MAQVAIRQPVTCSYCGLFLVRIVWNYGTSRAISNFFCDNKCKGSWQRAQREALGFTKEWLIEQYITKGRTAPDIAREVGRDAKRVWEWIVDYDIPTRSRGYCTDQLPKDGSPFRGKHHTADFKKNIRALALATGRVPYDPKVGSYMKGRKGANTPNWKGGSTPERQALYSSAEWKECVKAVWKRDDATCRRCRLDHRTILRGTISFHIHHIDSFLIKERRACVDNLVLLCYVCHKWTHSKQNKKRFFLGVAN